MRRNPGSDVDKFSDTLDSGCLMEVACRDGFPVQRMNEQQQYKFGSLEPRIPHNIKVCSGGDNVHLLELHDIF